MVFLFSWLMGGLIWVGDAYAAPGELAYLYSDEDVEIEEDEAKIVKFLSSPTLAKWVLGIFVFFVVIVAYALFMIVIVIFALGR